MKILKRIGAMILCIVMLSALPMTVSAKTILYDYPEEEDDRISAPSAMMMYLGVKAEQDVVLYEKNADARYQPGSLMRVAMLGYAMKLVTEKHINVDKTTAAYSLTLFNHYVAGTGLHVALMNFGETWTLRDLITVCALQTAADCAVTLAVALCETPEAFVEGLNAFAQELGCENSHFTNVTCLNEEGQYMSARDVMTFTRYAYEFPLLQSAFELKQYTVTPVSGGKARSWPTSNEMVRASSGAFYTYAIGGKSGGTLTETSIMEYGGKDGYEYMAVVMGARRKDDKDNIVFDAYADARRLIRWGLLDFSYEMLARKNEPVGRLPVENCPDKDTVSLVPTEDFFTVLSTELDVNTLKRRVVCEKTVLSAPVKAGETMGVLELYHGEELVGTVPLVTGESASYNFLYAAWCSIRNVLFSGWTVAALILIALLFIAYILYNIQYNRKKQKESAKDKAKRRR